MIRRLGRGQFAERRVWVRKEPSVDFEWTKLAGSRMKPEVVGIFEIPESPPWKTRKVR